MKRIPYLKKGSKVAIVAPARSVKQDEVIGGIKWLEESFNEFLAMSDKAPGWGQGGQPDSQFNREVLAGKVIQHFDGVGSGHELSEEQLSRLKESLSSIVNEKNQNSIKL